MGWRVMYGNDLFVTWNVTDKSGTPYDFTGKTVEVECSVSGCVVQIENVVAENDAITFFYAGANQRRTGSHDLKCVVNKGTSGMITFDLVDAFTLVPHTYQEVDGASETLGVVYVSLVSAVGSKGEKGDKGDKGDTGDTGANGADGADGADGFSPTVSVTSITGGHTVTITDANGSQSFNVMDGVDGQGSSIEITGDGSGVYVNHVKIYSTPPQYFTKDAGNNITLASGYSNLYVNGWLSAMGTGSNPVSGDSMSRPVPAYVGQFYFDTTLNKPIWYKGDNVWIDAAGSTV